MPIKKNLGVINVLDFGAKGDGVTDDTAAIQKAIDYASLNGKEVNFQDGVFLVSTRLVLKTGVKISGGVSTIKLKPGTSQNSNPDIILIKDISDVVIEGIKFDGSNDSLTKLDANVFRGVLIQNAENVKIVGCQFKDFQHQAIQVSGATPQNSSTKGVYNLAVSNCDFKNIWSALHVTESDSKSILFTNNNVENAWEHGLTTYPGVSYVTVSHNKFKNVGLRESPTFTTFNAGCGIRIFETVNSIVLGNIIVNPNFCGIRITTNSPTTFQQNDFTIVSSNIIRGGERNGGSGSGILVGEQGKSANVVLSDNIIENFMNYNFAEGIKLIGDGVIVSGNRVKNIKQTGITVLGNLCQIVGNSLSDTGLYGVVIGGTTAVDGTSVVSNTVSSVSQQTPIGRGYFVQNNATGTKFYGNMASGTTIQYFNGTTQPLNIDGLFRDGSQPTTGTYQKGDITVNTNPTDGSPSSWVCTVAGSPGTWQPVGIVKSSKLASQTDSVATDVAGLKADFNALLAKLRSAGLM